MTSRERVLAAMRRQQPDRVPINMRGVQVWDQEWMAARDPSYGPLIEAVQEHCDIIPVAGVGGTYHLFLTAASDEITEHHTLEAGEWTIQRVVVHTPKGDLTEDTWESKLDYLPMTKKRLVETPEDAERVLSIAYQRPHLDVSDYLRLRREWPDNVVMCMITEAAEQVHELVGTETFAYWWTEHRELLFRLREAFEQRCLDVLDFVLEAGVGPVLATNGCEQVAPPIFSPQTYREFVLPAFGELCRRIHDAGGLLHVHCHNRLSAVLEDLVAAGWDVTHPVEPPPMGDVVLADAKRRVGRDLCLEGNLQIGELYAAPTEALVHLVKETMRDGKPGGGFILCPSASPHTRTLSDLTVRNYLAMIETGVRMREY
jgi:hypothetical protein